MSRCLQAIFFPNSIINTGFKSKINWVWSPCCDFDSFLPAGFHTFFNSFPWGWDELCHKTYQVRLTQCILFSRVFQRLFLSDLVLLITQERSCFFSWVIGVEKLICWGVISCGASCGLVWKWFWGQSNLPLMPQH